MNSPDEMAARLTSNVEENEHYVCANLGGKVKRTLGKLSLVREAVAAYYCARDHCCQSVDIHCLNSAAILFKLVYWGR